MIKIRRSWGPPAGHGALSRPLVHFCLGPALHIIYRRLCINNLLGLFGCELCFCKRSVLSENISQSHHKSIEAPTLIQPEEEDDDDGMMKAARGLSLSVQSLIRKLASRSYDCWNSTRKVDESALMQNQLNSVTCVV